MPTRIVLDSNPVPSQLSTRQNQFPHVHLNPLRKNNESPINKAHETTGGGTNTDKSLPEGARKRAAATSNNPSRNFSSTSSYSRRTSGFRSSILRELSVRQDSREMNNNNAEDDNRVRISSGDIRASPRFLGYLFSSIAGSVLLVSVVQFFEKVVLDDAAAAEFFEQRGDPASNTDKFFVTPEGDLVYRWKLWGAIWASSAMIGICLLIMLVHYDTVCLPKLWMAVFRDGSLAERNIIMFLVLLWIAAIHIGTSSLSVGQVQANVFFTSWIAFGSIALTYGVWRESAGLPTLMDMMNQHKRETTYNWIWVMIFSIVFAGAATDIYYNRDEIELRYQGEVVDLRKSRWIWVLAVLWADCIVCSMAILFNEIFTGYRKLPCVCQRPTGRYRFILGWRQIEGFVMSAGIAAKFWVIWEYTGVDGVVNGLNNGYFGIWGSFFNSVFALGTWLKENQNTEYFVKEDNDRDKGSTPETFGV